MPKGHRGGAPIHADARGHTPDGSTDQWRRPGGPSNAVASAERRLLVLLAMRLTVLEAAWLLAGLPAEMVADRARLFRKSGAGSDNELAPSAVRHGLAA
jgi:hypothetical protein